ncbi:MAG: hypothetical protein M3Y38_06100 [Actinomycetota bacterium]|nr:hypothetical protein [Actinomycetota bacterium]
MYRAAALILAVIVVVFFAAQLAEEPVRALQMPEVRPAPEAFEAAGASGAGDAAGPTPDGGGLKIGSFEAPQRVPDYEVLEESFDTRDGARAARLLVDTRSRGEEEYVPIARDVKHRYSDYDAISVEFTDTEDVLFYNDDPLTKDLLVHYGGALIFNTYEGAYYLGYIYGPPNMEGYYVKAVD